MEPIAKFFLICLICVASQSFLVETKKMDGKGKSGMGMDLIGVRKGLRTAPTCKGQPIDTSSMMSAMDACKSEMSSDSPCFSICILKKLNLVDDDLQSPKDPTVFVTSTFPESAQANIIDAMNACFKNTKFPLSTDNNCSSVSPLRKCMMSSAMKICKP